MAIKFRFLGGGNLPGIPARDLTDDDDLSAEQWKLVAENAKHAKHEETKQAAVFAEPEKPATTKGG